jgi:hypothetical protein
VLVTLAMVLDDTTLSEKIQVEFRQGNYLKSDEDLSDPTGTQAPMFLFSLCARARRACVALARSDRHGFCRPQGVL